MKKLRSKLLIVIAVYLSVAALSCVLLSGWIYADACSRLEPEWRGMVAPPGMPAGMMPMGGGDQLIMPYHRTADAANKLALTESLAWPVAVPRVYIQTGRAAHGWKTTWGADDECCLLPPPSFLE